MNVLISVIVTTKNEEANIKNCLESIVAQDLPAEHIEIIVVDNNSTDKTKEIASIFTENVFNFGTERSSQRNYGVKIAKGKYILYLDADMILSRSVISECLAVCEKNKYAGLYIPESIVGKGFWIKVRNFERSFYNATVIDCVRFIPKDIFLEVNGFDESLTGPEDWDLDMKIRSKGKTGIIVAAIYHNEGDFCFKQYLAKKEYYARSFKKYISKWGSSNPDIKKQFGFFYRFFDIFFRKGGWVKLLIHPILTFGIYFLRFLVGFMYIVRLR